MRAQDDLEVGVAHERETVLESVAPLLVAVAIAQFTEEEIGVQVTGRWRAEHLGFEVPAWDGGIVVVLATRVPDDAPRLGDETFLLPDNSFLCCPGLAPALVLLQIVENVANEPQDLSHRQRR